MTQVDVFELAVSTRDGLRSSSDEVAEPNAINAIDAVTAASPGTAEPARSVVDDTDAVSSGEAGAETRWGEVFHALDAVTPNQDRWLPDTPHRRSPVVDMPDPGAKCAAHNRFLTFAEQLHGRCSWCEWQERTGHSAQRGARADS